MGTFVTRRASICVLIFLSASLPKVLRAEVSIPVDIAGIAKQIKEFVLEMLKTSSEAEKERLKNSAASVSARMTRIAGMKESFAEFLENKPIRISEFRLQVRSTADHELRLIDHELAGLEQDLRMIDPTWAARYPDLNYNLSAIINGKGLRWAAEYGPHGDGQNTVEFRDWLRKQAEEFRKGASAIREAII